MEPMSDTQTESQQGLPEGEAAPQPADEIVPASGTEQPSPEEATPAEPEPKKVPWFQRRIDEVTREKHEANRRADALEAQLRNVQRPQQQPQQAPQRTDMVPISEVEKLVEQRATVQQFNDACNATYDAGSAKYADFDEAVSTFGLLGGPPPAFLEAVTSLGKEDGARVFYDLGKNPDEAARILGLPPVKMAMALAKMASAPAKALPVSRAPAPIAPIASRGVSVNAEPDAKNTDDWVKWFKAQRNKR